jgi:hypothetical protein
MKWQGILCVLILGCAMACGANEEAPQQQPMARPPASATNAPAGGSAAADNQIAAAKSRALLVLLDSSRSYALYEKAIGKLLSIVEALGPGDQIIIAQVAEKFRPEANIRLQAKMPEMPAELLVINKRLVEWRQNQARLNTIWRQVEGRRREIAAYVTTHLVGKNNAAVTDLHGALAYSAQWLGQSPASGKHLIIFSDLEHDFEKLKTSQPPAQRLDFASVHVCLLYVPWTDKWEGWRKEWATWFNRAGTTDFLMLEAGRSDSETVVAPVLKPQPPSPLWQGSPSRRT